jgi:hypothetical protein
MPFEERLPAGKDETVAEIPEIDQVPKFNAAAAVPFVPKIEGEMPPDPSSEQSKITESAKAEASS